MLVRHPFNGIPFNQQKGKEHGNTDSNNNHNNTESQGETHRKEICEGESQGKVSQTESTNWKQEVQNYWTKRGVQCQRSGKPFAKN